ncbi:MAG TPA: HAD family phosphatase [Phycisphaerae bacterium]|nr:HAD family phosphatase [Phycisphaerae bacterium]
MTRAPQWPTDPDASIPPDVRGLIFDCDGTLVDTMPLHYVAWVKALEQVGIQFPEERFYSFAGAPTRTIIEILAKEQHIDCDPLQVAIDKEKLYTENLEQLEPIHSVIEIARREKGKRKLAVASGGWKRVVKASLTVVGIEDMFEAIVGADDVAHGKPAPDVFLKAAELLHLRPEECVVYEDGEMGIQAAEAAKMRVIDVRPWYLPRGGTRS